MILSGRTLFNSIWSSRTCLFHTTCSRSRRDCLPENELLKIPNFSNFFPDWFSKLFGFHEREYERTKELFLLRGSRLYSRVNGKGYEIGKFETPSLQELRERVLNNNKKKDLKEKCGGELRIGNIISEISELHNLEENKFATFQVASQFNCLEFIHPSIVPEDGVTNYVSDRTQGPACSIACAPATVYRNYFAIVDDDDDDDDDDDENDGGVGGGVRGGGGSQKKGSGQTRSSMIDNLKDVCKYIGNDKPDGPYFRRRGGYTLADDSGLKELNLVLEKMREEEEDPSLDEVKKRLRIGLQRDTEVTSRRWGSRLNDNIDKQLVSQVFGSACSVSYSGNSPDLWEPFAKLILQSSYEATLLTAIENVYQHHDHSFGSNSVYLTLLGGGVFGNEVRWIYDAVVSACLKYRHFDLDVRVVFKSEVLDLFVGIGDDFRKRKEEEGEGEEERRLSGSKND